MRNYVISLFLADECFFHALCGQAFGLTVKAVIAIGGTFVGMSYLFSDVVDIRQNELLEIIYIDESEADIREGFEEAGLENVEYTYIGLHL